MPLPFLILETGTPVMPMRRHGGFPHWIRVAAGLRDEKTRVVDATAGALPRARGHAGILVTGSGAMVSDREPWSEATSGWLRAAVEDGVPVFGICYGHQLLAHAFGGRVADNPAGREMGTIEVVPTPAAAGDPLFGDASAPFRAQATHLQSVLEPPAGAVLLARTALDACAAFRLGEQAWGVQFHPEFSARHMQGYIAARAPTLRAEGHDPIAMHAAVRSAPVARAILRQFIRHASRRHG